MPVIGVAKSGWNLDQLKQRAKDSVEKYGGLDQEGFAKLMDVLRYIDGDYAEPATFQQLAERTGRRATSLALSGHPSQPLRRGGQAAESRRLYPGRARGGGKALRQGLDVGKEAQSDPP